MSRTNVVVWWILGASAWLPAQRALLDQLPPDQEAYTLRASGVLSDLAPLELPGEGRIQGLAKVGKLLWIARGADLWAVEWSGLQTKTKVQAPEGVLALTADERFLYALRASDILVLDPLAGHVVRMLPGVGTGRTEPTAMAYLGGSLLVVEGGLVVAVDTKTGAASGTAMRLGRGERQWLASDGASLWAGGPGGCLRFVPGERPRWVTERAWPRRLTASAATWIEDRLLFTGEWTDEQGKLVRSCGLLKPSAAVPEERLSLQLYADERGVKYVVGPKPVFSPETLTAELSRIARDPSSKVPWPDGTVRRMPVVIEVFPGVRMGEVCKAWDLAVAAGFPDVQCPAQEEWARQQARAKAGSPPAQRTLLDRLPPDADVGDHLDVKFGDEFTPIGLPGAGSVLGIAAIGDHCWVLRGKELHCLDRAGKLLRTVMAPDGMVGLTADARFLYGFAGKEVQVIDPTAGTAMRTVPLATAWPPLAIVAHREQLHVLVDHTLLVVDLPTGATKEVTQLADAVQWLASDGHDLWCGTSTQCRPVLLAGETKAWPGRRWPLSARESAAAWVDGRLLVALEARGGGAPPPITAGFLTTVVADPPASVSLFIHRQDGELVYLVGAEPLTTEDALRAALRREAGGAKPGLPRRYAPKAPLPLELHPERGITVRELVRIWDLALAVGVASVHCPGVEAWAREVQRGVVAPSRTPEKK